MSHPRPPSPPLRRRVSALPAAAVLLATLLLTAGSAAAPWPARAQQAEDLKTELEKKRATIDKLGREEAETRRRLSTFSASEEELRSEISKLADLVRESRQRKEELEETIETQNKAMADQEAELKRAEKEIARSRQRISQRLRRMYRLTKLGGTAALFQHSRLQTLTRDSVYLTMLQEGDRRAIRQYEVLGRELKERRTQVAKSLERLKALREELKTENAQLADRERFLSESLRNVAKNRKLYRTYLEDLEKMRQEMSAAVTKMEKEATTRKAKPLAVNPESLRGSLPPPVPGKLIARFGENDPRYEMKKFQRGIVLEVQPRAPVLSVAPGRVVHAGAFRGYQSLVVLDHGRGLFSVYGHLERLQVKRGAWVAQDQVLGRATYQPVGDTHNVYFEIRVDGEPEDPLGWLRKDAYGGE